MPSHLELAMLCKQIYFKKGGFVPGWECREFYSDNEGLAVGVYENNSNEMVIAFRGTDTANFNNFLKNLITDLHIIYGNQPNTLTKANSFVSLTRNNRGVLERLSSFLFTGCNNQLYLTGHSLGGLLAQLVGYTMLQKGKNYRVVTFENPGMADHVPAQDKKNYADEFQNNFITYLSDPNLINTLHPHLGKIRRVFLKPYNATFFSKASYYGTHVVDCVINDALRILLLLLFINLLFLILKKQTLANYVSLATDHLSSQLQKQEYIGEIQTDDPLSSLIFLLKNTAYFVLSKTITKSISSTARQHMLDAMISQLHEGKGEPSKYSEIIQWPSTKQYISSHLHHSIKWFNVRKHPSLLTLTSPLELHEERVRNIDGYQAKEVVVKHL